MLNNKVGFSMPIINFQGKQEVSQIVKQAAGINLDSDPYVSHALGNLMMLLNRSTKEDIIAAATENKIDQRIRNLIIKKAELH